MGRLSAVLPDELEERLRRYFQKIYGLRIPRGVISTFIADAVREKLDRLEAEENEFREDVEASEE